VPPNAGARSILAGGDNSASRELYPGEIADFPRGSKAWSNEDRIALLRERKLKVKVTDNNSRMPEWLRVKVGKQKQSRTTQRLLRRHGLNTVCENARCPNIGECFSHHTATFMLMGETCTRNCRFCAVNHAAPGEKLGPLDADEPRRVAEAAADLGLQFTVVTSVTRDDLVDGGAAHFAHTIRALRKRLPAGGVEVLTPDFQGDEEALEAVLAAGPTVFNHNVETVREMTPILRPQADYERSLQVLTRAARNNGDTVVKSGFMVGVGESDEQLRYLLDALGRAGCDIVTIGQYLQPTRQHLPVDRYVAPEQFDEYARWAQAAGIREVSSGPFVRSSYHAGELASAVLKSRGIGDE